MPCCTRNLAIVFAVLTAFLCAGSAVLAVIGRSQIEKLLVTQILNQRIITSKNSSGYAQWVSSDFKDAPIQYFNVYAFNVTNPDEVTKGAKPILNQVGPFIYVYHTHFFNITWLEDETLVSNMKFERYNWQKEGSYGDPTKTELIWLNVPYAAIRAEVDGDDQWWSSLAFDLVTSAANESLFTRATVDEYVWGYDSPFLKWINDHVTHVDSTLFQLQTNDTSEVECSKRLKYQSDIYYTGKSDGDLLNTYVQWHGMRNLGVWGSEAANNVTGYDGTGYMVEIPPKKNLTVFVDTLYRHLQLWHNMTEEVKGITLNRYWLSPENFFNASMGYPNYNLNAPQGLSNMTGPMNVMQGSPVPIFMSLPLFFQSDDSYFEAVEFMPPNDQRNMSLHNTEIMVEPITGITMKAAKRIQVNVKIDPTLILYPNISTTYFPVCWFELASTISDPLAAQFRNQVLLAKKIAFYCPYVLGGVGGFLLLVVLFASFKAHTLRRHTGYDVIDTIN